MTTMRAIFVFRCLASILALLAATGPVPAQVPTEVRLALVYDGPIGEGNFRPDLLRTELRNALGGRFTVTIEPDDRYLADDTVAGVEAALERALTDPGIDLVVCAGVISSLVATQRHDLPRPVIAVGALSIERQSLPLTAEGTSGVSNLNYVVGAVSFLDDIQALESVVGDIENVTVLGSDVFFLALPGLVPGSEFTLPTGEQVTVRSAGDRAETALANLPDETDAVMLMPLAAYDRREVAALLAGLKDRRLPTVALLGELLVEQGALIGTTSKDWQPRVYRRVGLHARRILDGQDAATLPVVLERQGALYINMQTARAIGVYPPFSVMVDAVQIAGEQITGRQIDLWQAMDETMAENRDLAAAERLLAADREEMAIARANLLPQIDLGLAGSMIDEDRAAVSQRPSERSVTASAELNQVIYSDAAWANYEVQKRFVAQREAEFEQQRLDVALEGATAYIQVIRAKTGVRLETANLRVSRQNLEQARVRVRLGDANRSEEFRWQTKIADEKARLIQSLANLKQAEMDLNRVLNRPLEEAVLLAEPDLDAQLSLMLDSRVERYLGDAWHLKLMREYVSEFARRVSPELMQITAGIGAQERVLTGTKRSFFIPDVGLNLGWQTYLAEDGAGSEGRSEFFPNDHDWNAAVVMSLPLFTSGRRFAETRQAGKDLVSLRIRYQAAEARIDQRVRSAVYQASASKAAIDLSREAADASRQNFELVRDNYARGAVDLITLLDAQNAYFRAEIAAADAVFGFLLDLMELERSVGRFTYFATNQEREAWLADLEAWFATREN